MTDSQPLVCVFFQLPPSQHLSMQIHDIPWLVLLPQLDKLSTALETLLLTNTMNTMNTMNPSPTAKKTLRESRKVMGSKMIPLRDFILSSRKFSIHYLNFVKGVSEGRMLSAYVKGAYSDIVQKTGKKIEEAQQALSEFREELERGVVRVMSLMGDNDNVSLFITESRLIVSVMITAIEECKALLQECSESFMNGINKQAFDPESFDRNFPSDEEFEFVEEKWEMLENLLHGLCVDWSLLEGRMEIPHSNRRTWGATPQSARDAVVLRGISENLPPPEKAKKISFWQKFFQRISHFLSKPFS